MNNFGSVRPALLGLTREKLERFAKPSEKRGFVTGDNPAMTGADPAAAGMDPAMAGGGMDPAMMGGGMDPAMMGGGAPPAGGSDPTAGMANATPDISSMIQQQVQAAVGAAPAGAGAGAGAGAMGGGVKPKVDQNIVMLQILKLLAKIADALQIPIPASEMVVTGDDLTQMASQQQGGGAGGGGAGGGGAGGGSAVQPIQPMQGASPALAQQKQGGDREGFAYPISQVNQQLDTISTILQQRRR